MGLDSNKNIVLREQLNDVNQQTNKPTNTDDQALPGMTSSRGIYIKVPLDQEEIATELLDAEPHDDN